MRYLGLALVFLACSSSPRRPVPHLTNPRGFVNDHEVCQRYRELGCPTGNPTPSGVTCEQVFANAREAGIVMDASPECIAQAETCQALDHC